MEAIDIKQREYITIKEAQLGIVNRSGQWYRQKIQEGKIVAYREGFKKAYLIQTSSLLEYLKGLPGLKVEDIN